MMQANITREEALTLLRKYNKEPFHIQHGLTVEGVMRWFAKEQGYPEEEEFWGIVGLLHDIDFEEYPDQHCIKAPGLLREAGVSEEVIHAVCSHGYDLTVDIKPEHQMEKTLYAVDELTGLVWAAALIRPSKSVQDMEVKSLKKKYKTATFAAGCSREVIERGAAMMEIDLSELMEKTILAMRSCEQAVADEMQALGLNES